MTKLNVKKTAAGAVMAGALGLGALGLGSGLAQADPGNPGPPVPPTPGIPWPVPGVPNIGAWVPGMPPGQNPFGPPGQVMKMPMLTIDGVAVPNPFRNVPPGHWGDLNYLRPDLIEWTPPEFPDVTAPLMWNVNLNQWGVWVGDQFVRFPIPLPAPPPPQG